MSNEVRTQVDESGLFIHIPLDSPGCYISATVFPNQLRKIIAEWEEIDTLKKQKIVDLERKHSRRKNSGTIMR